MTQPFQFCVNITIIFLFQLFTYIITNFLLPFFNFIFCLIIIPGCPRDVMVKAMDCGIVECEFGLQSRYYIHFQANTLGKSMNPLILPARG